MNCNRPTGSLIVAVGLSALFLAGLLMPCNTMAVDVPVTSGLSVWLRADTGVLTNATGYVTNWQDQATSDGSQNATQTTAANQPLFVASASGLNNQSVVRFDGVSDANWDKLNLGNVGGAFTAATLFVVHTVTLNKAYSIYSSSANQTYWQSGLVGPFYSHADGTDYRYNQGGSFGNYPGAPSSGSHITEFRAGSDYTEYTDGTSLGTLTTVNTASDVFGGYKFKGGSTHSLGGDSTLNTFGGDVAEVLVYNRLLTDTERNQVGAYLKDRYGISANYYIPPSAAPSGLTATAASSSRITLSWVDNSSNETGFKVERATDSGFMANLTLVTTTAANATNFTDTGLSATTTYYYRVRATNPAGDSGNSGSANATTLLAVVSDSLSVWLRADMGVLTNATGYVTNWQDQATFDGSQNGTNATAANQPLFVASAAGLNNQPVVRFDGVKDSTGDRLLLGNLSNKFTTGEATLFVVYTGDSSLGANYSVYSHGAIGGSYWNQGKVGPFYCATTMYYRYNENGSFGNYPDTPCAGNHIVEFRAGSDYTEFTNGVSLGTLTVANTASDSGGSYKFWGGNDHRIGNDSSAETLNFRGDVAELLIYNRALNAAERVIVENSLSARYGMVLGANDVYTGDNPAKGDYDLDVIGIGSKTSDALAPGKISTSENVAGLQLVELNGSLADGEFLLAGHKVAANSWTTSDMPAGRQRSSRVWYVEKTGTVDATFTFDCVAAGLGVPTKRRYSLMYSSSPTFSFSQVSVNSPTGSQVSFSLTDTQLVSGYYTIGEAPLVGSTFIVQ